MKKDIKFLSKKQILKPGKEDTACEYECLKKEKTKARKLNKHQNYILRKLS